MDKKQKISIAFDQKDNPSPEEEEKEEGKVMLNLLSVIYDFEEKNEAFLSSYVFSCFEIVACSTLVNVAKNLSHTVLEQLATFFQILYRGLILDHLKYTLNDLLKLLLKDTVSVLLYYFRSKTEKVYIGMLHRFLLHFFSSYTINYLRGNLREWWKVEWEMHHKHAE